MRTDRQTDMTELILAFCNFANAPKNRISCTLLRDLNLTEINVSGLPDTLTHFYVTEFQLLQTCVFLT